MDGLEVVCFDMDGTLLNSGNFGVVAVGRGYEEMISDGRLPGVSGAPDADAIRAEIGKPPWEFYPALLPDGMKERAEELHGYVIRHEVNMIDEASARLFEGAREVLDVLKTAGLKLMLVSNCSDNYMNAVVDNFELIHWDYRACVGDKNVGRTKTGLVGAGLRQLGVSRGVMVGDRFHDREAAADNGLGFIGCAYGYGKAEELEGARAIIDDIRELPRALGV